MAGIKLKSISNHNARGGINYADRKTHTYVLNFGESSIQSLIGLLTELTLQNLIRWEEHGITGRCVSLGKNLFEVFVRFGSDPPTFWFNGCTLESAEREGDYGLDKLIKAILDQKQQIKELDALQLANAR